MSSHPEKGIYTLCGSGEQLNYVGAARMEMGILRCSRSDVDSVNRGSVAKDAWPCSPYLDANTAWHRPPPGYTETCVMVPVLYHLCHRNVIYITDTTCIIHTR